MLIYEYRNRLFHFEGEGKPTFPAHAVISTALAPRVPFGGVAGPTRTSAVGVDVRARVSPSTGRFTLEAKAPLFEPLSAGLSGSERFSMEGHIATVETTVGSLQEVADLLGALSYVLPAILNLEIVDAPYSLHSWGRIGDSKFQWHYHPQELRASVKIAAKESQEQTVVRSWQRAGLIRRNLRLFMSFHYFCTACRLLMSGQHRFEFMAEAVLNFAKCLQALCGESRDDVRSVLRQLGIADNEIEALYMPALFLRDSFNVAHISLTQYSLEQLRAIHTYVELAENAFRRLLVRVMEQHEAGTFAPSSQGGSVSSREAAIIERLGENLKSYEAAAARAAVTLDETGTSHPAFLATAPTQRRGPPTL